MNQARQMSHVCHEYSTSLRYPSHIPTKLRHSRGNPVLDIFVRTNISSHEVLEAYLGICRWATN